VFGFEWWWAGLALPAPWLVRRLLPAATGPQQAALQVPFFSHISQLELTAGRTMATTRGRWIALLMWLALVLACMRPQWLGEPIELPVSGRDLMLGVDISVSMREQDFSVGGRTVNRLDMVKTVASDFIARREGDRVGLILFADNAYIQTPLTYDLTTVQHFLDEAMIGLVGKSTAIGEAIGLAVKRLRQRPQEARVLVLLTDGSNTAGAVLPDEAARLAAKEGVRVHTIGVGAEQVVSRGLFGNRLVNPSLALDEETLQEIADITGGRYFRARNTSEMEEIYQLIDQLEPTESEASPQRPLRELYPWPLALALLASVCLAWVRSR
jgi:Ca-activated chloride channel family protein